MSRCEHPLTSASCALVDAEEGLPHVLQAFDSSGVNSTGRPTGWLRWGAIHARELSDRRRTFLELRPHQRFMFSEPVAWNELMSKLAEDDPRRYLLAQVEAGAGRPASSTLGWEHCRPRTTRAHPSARGPYPPGCRSNGRARVIHLVRAPRPFSICRSKQVARSSVSTIA